MKKDTLNRKAYPTDLTEWAVIAPLFSGMREFSKRELLNAVLYLVDNGLASIATRISSLANCLQFFSSCKETGLWDKILQHLVEVTRRRAGRNTHPTYAIIDSQSVDTAYASEQIGFDGVAKDINATS